MTTAYITHSDCLRHEMGAGHPECPERLVAVNEHMRSSGLLESQWRPALDKFKPQMVLISAGFDAHRDDLLGGLALVEEDYGWMTRELMSVARQYADSRIVSMLEGGYNFDALGASAVAHVSALAAA
jgi:acetoin utilization deacetylase AcuC-like enzyme